MYLAVYYSLTYLQRHYGFADPLNFQVVTVGPDDEDEIMTSTLVRVVLMMLRFSVLM